MVPEPVEQREAVEENKEVVGTTVLPWWVMLLVFMVALLVMILVTLVVVDSLDNGNDVPTDGEMDVSETVADDTADLAPEVVAVEKVDFQEVVDEWVESVGGQKGVIVYDLTAGAVAGEYNADTKFATASLYKLFVVYVGYMKVENGEWGAGDVAGITGRTVGECLDLAIRESDSECAETLWEMIGRDELDAVMQNKFGLIDVEVGDYIATPREVMEMMRIYYMHSEISDVALVTTMWDSFLNQPVTEYDWRQGLPSGFSDEVLVYNKVGWEYDGEQWLIYDDAAIVDFVSKGRAFIVVVMTSKIDYRKIRWLGRMLEAQMLVEA